MHQNNSSTETHTHSNDSRNVQNGNNDDNNNARKVNLNNEIDQNNLVPSFGASIRLNLRCSWAICHKRSRPGHRHLEGKHGLLGFRSRSDGLCLLIFNSETIDSSSRFCCREGSTESKHDGGTRSATGYFS